MSLGHAAVSKGYRTAHFGKWHLGSLAQLPHARTANGSCGRGPASTWCAPHDGELPTSSPLTLGFDTFTSTPQCAPSASANCACAQAAAPVSECRCGFFIIGLSLLGTGPASALHCRVTACCLRLGPGVAAELQHRPLPRQSWRTHLRLSAVLPPCKLSAARWHRRGLAAGLGRRRQQIPCRPV